MPGYALPASTHPSISTLLLEVHHRLYETYGPQHWWPGETPFEVIIGAILTQSVAWTNVERAISTLKQRGLLSPASLRKLPLDELATILRPTGYYNDKARKVKAFVDHLAAYDDALDRLFDQDVPSLRRELLSIHGIGEETADCIVLYAAGKPSFVIDAFTRRITERLTLPVEGNGYGAYQALFERSLPKDAELFNEYHALLVRLAKERCRKREPICDACTLADLCPTGAGRLSR